MSLLLALAACTWLPQPYENRDYDTLDLCQFEAPPEGMAQVAGRISSPNGELPVAGAKVDFAGFSTFSGEGGCFAFDLDPTSTQTLSVEKGRYTAEREVDTWPDERTDLGVVKLDDGGVRMAVVYGKFDDVGELIADLGIPYDAYAEPEELYGDPALLAQYDAVFANCGSTHSTQNASEYSQQELDNVRDWILDGGTLYASDWEFELFEGAMPEAAIFGEDPLRGEAGTLTAQILDRNIEALLGSDQAQITYDLTGWAVVDEADQGTPLVLAQVEGTARPLALMHWEGEGRAVFTSFHNEAQMTEDMRLILYELILAL